MLDSLCEPLQVLADELSGDQDLVVWTDCVL